MLKSMPCPISAESTQLHQSSSDTNTGGGVGGLFGRGSGGGGILSGLFGGGGGGPTQQPGPQVVLDLPSTNVKVGALRFLLQIYLVGEQNKPAPNSWFTKQGDDGTLELYFRDGTGMISIDLSEYNIQATRYGERPSLAYQLQESVMLHGILDELNGVAFDVDETIKEEKRLLRFSNPNAIQDARSKLPAKSA